MRNSPALLLALLLLAGCGLPPRNTATAYTFALQPVEAAARKPAPLHLAVGFPKAAPELDSARVALLHGHGTWDYYAGAKWADFLPVIVQDGMIKSIEDARLFQTVTGDGAHAPDEELKISIRHFEAQYGAGNGAPTVHIQLQMILFDRHTLAPMATFEAHADRKAASDSLPAINKAFREAFAETEAQTVAALAHNRR